MNRLTKQEQLVLCIVLGLLLTGWAVRTCRIARLAETIPAKPAGNPVATQQARP